MEAIQHDTVLLVCRDPLFAERTLRRFYQAGHPIVGPVSTAAMALALAAQAAPRVALVAQPLTGRRNTLDLARELMRQWGIRSLLLKDALPRGLDGAREALTWRPSLAETRRLMDLLSLPSGRQPALSTS
jgi:hypothetical protein